jgi:hypothetical protein
MGGKATAGKGGGGAGGAGAGGRAGAGGGNCVTKIQQNGYAFGSAAPCSVCKDNSTSLKDKCEDVIDCLEKKWPCSGSCQTECTNAAGASMPAITCVEMLKAAACP